jgi:hypothetical protein
MDRVIIAFKRIIILETTEQKKRLCFFVLKASLVLL